MVNLKPFKTVATDGDQQCVHGELAEVHAVEHEGLKRSTANDVDV